MDGNKTLTANFTQTYTLTMSRNPSGGGSTAPSSSQSNISAGMQVSISATAGSGHAFSNWSITSGNGSIANANSSSTTVTVNGNVTVTANFETVLGTFTDSRDGKTYNTVRIGNQRWMAENLNYATASGSYSGNGGQYGMYYTWSAAKTACPSGWHLPSRAEWDALVSFAGGSSTAGTKLKSSSGWFDYNGNPFGNGTDDFGFSALPGGSRDSKAGCDGNWWTATETYNAGAYYRNMFCGSDEEYDFGSSNKEYSISVRCVQD
jgi:uncharacterized protein (TIGR02145 family)